MIEERTEQKVWLVWHDDCCEWVDYTEEELNKCFKFVDKPNWDEIRELYLFNSCFEIYLKLIHEDSSCTYYNNVHGTFAKIG